MEKKEKLLLISTGGTILSAVSDKCINVSQGCEDILIAEFQKNTSVVVDFEIIKPFQILSENAEPSHWLQIIELIKTLDFKEYTGILIAHGSDTLPYTAAALGYGLNTPSIPIVLVAANYAIGEPLSNAIANFSASVNFILNLKLPGIFTLYENSNGEIHVHIGTRLLEADWLKDDFQSFGGSLGIYTENGLCCLAKKTNPTMAELYNPVSNLVPAIETIKNQVMALRAFPGLDYSCIDLKSKPFRAVLHSLYHCGSGNVAGSNGTSLKEFILNNPHVDHYLISYKDSSGNLYATCHELIEAGGIALENICFEAAVPKLFFAYNQKELAPETYMKREFFHEFVREKNETGYIF